MKNKEHPTWALVEFTELLLIFFFANGEFVFDQF